MTNGTDTASTNTSWRSVLR